MKRALIVFFLLLATSGIQFPWKCEFPVLKGPYLGQKPPDRQPALFAPAIISTDEAEVCITFSKDGRECYFQRRREIFVTREKEGKWTQPRIVPFSGKFPDGDPFLSPDGKMLFFTSERPVNGEESNKHDTDIWYVKRNGQEWSEPYHLGRKINSDFNERTPSVASDGTLYFHVFDGKNPCDLFYSSFKNNEYSPPRPVEGLNTKINNEADAYISNDKDYILFLQNGISISFSDKNGDWKTPISLKDILGPKYENTWPRVTSDGKYLFFSSFRPIPDRPDLRPPDIYWVSFEAVLKEVNRSYLGQKPPGMMPEIFAPGIISTENFGEAGSAFSKSGDVFLFNRRRPPEGHTTIYFTRKKNGIWTEPSPVPFNSPYADWDFHFAPDGTTLYFTSKRPVNQDSGPSKYANIWMTELTHSGWSEPCMLGFPINTLGSHDCGATLTKDGTLYFFSRREGGLGQSDIYRARLREGKYVEVENLGKPINSEYSDYDSFIAPDGSYIIFSSDRPGGYGKYNDIYVSFHKIDGTWGEPKNLGYEFRDSGINGVTLDNKFLFYTCGRTGNDDIYWVNAKIIEDLKPEELK